MKEKLWIVLAVVVILGLGVATCGPPTAPSAPPAEKTALALNPDARTKVTPTPTPAPLPKEANAAVVGGGVWYQDKWRESLKYPDEVIVGVLYSIYPSKTEDELCSDARLVREIATGKLKIACASVYQRGGYEIIVLK